MLWYVMLCYAMLWYVMLCYVCMHVYKWPGRLTRGPYWTGDLPQVGRAGARLRLQKKSTAMPSSAVVSESFAAGFSGCSVKSVRGFGAVRVAVPQVSLCPPARHQHTPEDKDITMAHGSSGAEVIGAALAVPPPVSVLRCCWFPQTTPP